MNKPVKPFMEWLDDKVDEWDLREEVEAEMQKIALQQKIAELRESCGITQAQLAHRLGISQPAVAKIESTSKLQNVSLKKLFKLCLALGARPKIEFERFRSDVRPGLMPAMARAARRRPRAHRLAGA
jgi:transcriptional regulator with XRE-family HTH domain